jgi:hypothetical protein
MAKEEESVIVILERKEDRGTVSGVEGDGIAKKRYAVWTGI